MEPLVSVIIPVYNVADFVREAIDSVVNQTYKNLEIIIVDDGSTDGSGTVCDEYKTDSRVKVIHQENRGLSGARNTGLDAMTGDIVVFLDSDDAFYPQMIETMVAEMQRSDADIVICDFKWDDRTSGLERKSYSSEEALKVLISGKMELANWNKIYKKRIWDSFRFPEGHIYEGTRTTYKLLERAARIEQLPDCLMFHRTRSGSIVKTRSKENSIAFFLANQEFEQYVIEHTPDLFTEAERDRFLQWRFCQKIPHWGIIKEIDKPLADELRKAAIKQIPSIRNWGKKSKVKYEMFKYCPDVLYSVLKFRGKL